MSKKLPYGMVGGAYNAFIGEVHRKAIAFDPRATLAAGCFSIIPQENTDTGALYGVDSSRVYDNYQSMAEKESARPDGVRFVSITTPNSTHYEIAKTFLTHGINVVCEKPLCFTVEQAEELVALTKEKNLLFGMTYSYSGYTMVKVAKDMIAAGKIGKIIAVNAEYAQEWLIDELGQADPGTAKLSGWRSDPKVAGISNCVGDIGTHIENTVHYLTGLKIERLLATTNTYGKPLDMNANIIVAYENGVNGAYWCSQIACGKLNGLIVRIYGTEGSLEWEQHYPDYVRYTPKGRPPEMLSRGTGYLQQPSATGNRLPSGHPEGLYVAFANVYRNYISALIKKDAGQALAPADLDFPNAEDGLAGVRFVHAVIGSAKADSAWVNV
ncbi:MAG: Gfo/Idh/MocA family oxidoreductase [Oscillospiraceae bacterium]|jgi:predicted dehydrogenase|nr:Gfo/Idh/MocA family oxidoreductase [Oscillospiraceae bacterium]